MAGRSAPAPKRPPSSSPPAAWAAKLFSMAETSSFIAAMAARGGGDAVSFFSLFFFFFFPFLRYKKNPRLRELCLARLYAERGGGFGLRFLVGSALWAHGPSVRGTGLFRVG